MDMTLNILFGFEAKTITDLVIKRLNSMGYAVHSEFKYTKFSIREYIYRHPECNVVVLKEVFDSASYSADELAELADERDLNIVIVVSDSHKGTEYMQTLYAAGITGAVFQNGRKGGATVSQLAELISKKRGRKEAREYYGIGEAKVELGILSFDAFTELCNGLDDPRCGRHITERFATIAARMTPRQLEDFIRRMPEDKLSELREYEEFYKITDAMKQYGIDMKFKRPRHPKRAELPVYVSKIEEKSEEDDQEDGSTEIDYDSFCVYEDYDDDTMPAFNPPAHDEQKKVKRKGCKRLFFRKKPKETNENLSDDTDRKDNEMEGENVMAEKSKKGKEFKSKKRDDVKNQNTRARGTTMADTPFFTGDGKLVDRDKIVHEDKKNLKKKKELDWKKIVLVTGIAVGIIAVILVVVVIVSISKTQNSQPVEEPIISEEFSALNTGTEMDNTEPLVVAPSVNISKGNDVEEVDDGGEVLEIMSGDDVEEIADSPIEPEGVPAEDVSPEDEIPAPRENYVYIPDVLASNYADITLKGGSVVTGLDVVNYINAHPSGNYVVNNSYSNESITYINGGASAGDVPLSATYRVSEISEGYRFEQVQG